MKKMSIAKRLWITAASLAVGTVASDCQVTIRDAFVNATQATVASLLNPANFDFTALAEQVLAPR